MSVSIIIPTYNSGRTVKETIECALKQSYPDVEILVCDNGSTDDTEQIVKSFKTVRWYRNDTNIFMSGSVKRMLKICNGEFVSIFHSDDLYHKDIIKEQVEHFKDNQVSAVFTSGKVIDDQGNYLRNISLPFQGDLKGNIDVIFPLMLQHGNFLLCSSAMIRKSVFDKIGHFDEYYAPNEDQEMWLRMLKNGYSLVIINKPLVSYRVHDSQGREKVKGTMTSLSGEYVLYDNLLKTYKVKDHVLERYNIMKSKGYLFSSVNSLLAHEDDKFKHNLRESMKLHQFEFFSVFGLIQFMLYLNIRWLLRPLIGSILFILKKMGMQRWLNFLNFM